MRSYLLLLLVISISCFGQETEIVQEIVKIDDVLYEVSHGEHFAIDTQHVLVRLKSSVKKLPNDVKYVSESKSGIIEVEVPEGKDVVEYINELKANGIFESVEYKSNCNVYFSPNDENYSLYQNGYLNAIKVRDAWNYTTGSPSIKVAIIDTWIKKNHEDLGYGFGNNNYSNISYNLGYDYRGIPSNQTPDDNHGTRVAGVIGAKTNNYIGVAGISGGNYCQGITMMSYCLVDDSGAGPTHLYGDAIRQAVDDGAKVINLCIGHSETNDINNALYYAETHGVTVVCAAGHDTDYSVPYPASNPYTIAVGEISLINSQSHYLGSGLDLVASGTVYTTSNGANNYKTLSGTSAAAPQVTGTVALMLSVNPYLTPANIRSILRNTAQKVSGYTFDSNGWNGFLGYGLLNALGAVINAMNLEIEGPQLVNSSGQYDIDNLPSGVTVSWSLSNNYYNTGYNLLIQNYPSMGHCLIFRDPNHALMNDTLTAQIKYNGTTVRTLKKPDINAYAGFRGKYTSGNLSGNIPSSLYFNIKANTTTTVTSANFYDATVTYGSGATPTAWAFNPSDGVLNFKAPAGSTPVVINVHDVCGNNYTLYAMPLSYSINVSNGESGITVTLVEDGDASKDFTPEESWTLEIINAATGQVMATQSSKNRSETISTAGWPKGIYIVKVTIGKEELTEKIMVT